MTNIQTINNKPLESPTTPLLEKECSVKTYIAIAVVASAVAIVLLQAHLPGFYICLTLSSWYLCSALVCVLHKASRGSRMEKPMDHLYAFVTEINAIIKSILLFPKTLFSSYHKPRGNPQGQPILLINGYLSFGSTWDYLRKRLVEAGHGPVYTMNVGSFRSIETYAEQVKQKRLQIEQETGRKDIVYIGHSRGGVIAAHAGDAAAIITVGSPLKGTPAAYLGIGKDAAEMRPNTPFLQDLQERIAEQQGKTRFFHIASERDLIVPVSSALMQQDPDCELLLSDMGHLALVYSSRVADQICTWLTRLDISEEV